MKKSQVKYATHKVINIKILCFTIVRALENFGPLTMLLFSRIEKITRKNSNILEFSLLSIQTDGMIFIQKVLNFFTNNIRDATTNSKNREKVE